MTICAEPLRVTLDLDFWDADVDIVKQEGNGRDDNNKTEVLSKCRGQNNISDHAFLISFS